MKKSRLRPMTPGEVFGRLTVEEDLGIPWPGVPRKVRCRCVCGNTVVTRAAFLRFGHTRSCGCYKFDRITEANATHGQTYNNRTTEYVIWTNIIQRCTNPDNPRYSYYGGRGIRICEEWRNSFEAFRDYVGLRPKNRSLDRIDNNGNYEPGNVRWATYSEQVRNRRTKEEMNAKS